MNMLRATLDLPTAVRAEMFDMLCETHGYDSTLTSATVVAVDLPADRKQAFIGIIDGCGMRCKLTWSDA